jgi:hypothetical protein
MAATLIDDPSWLTGFASVLTLRFSSGAGERTRPRRCPGLVKSEAPPGGEVELCQNEPRSLVPTIQHVAHRAARSHLGREMDFRSSIMSYSATGSAAAPMPAGFSTGSSRLRRTVRMHDGEERPVC